MARAMPLMDGRAPHAEAGFAPGAETSPEIRNEIGNLAQSEGTGAWGKRMSDNVAYALLVYTGLQIFVTIHALRETGSSFLPMLALVVLVAAIIPLCRRFERRWEDVCADDRDAVVHAMYRRDQLVLWGLAGGLPFLLTGLFKGFVAVT